MRHGVHAVQHEGEHDDRSTKIWNMPSMPSMPSHSGNKKIALLISVLALFLAFSETLGKSAQTAAITFNVEAPTTCGRSSRPRPSA